MVTFHWRWVYLLYIIELTELRLKTGALSLHYALNDGIPLLRIVHLKYVKLVRWKVWFLKIKALRDHKWFRHISKYNG